MSNLYDDNTVTAYNSSNMTKSAIKQLQQTLINNGFDVGKSGVDGIWGKDTANAVRNYYNSIGYKVNNNGYTISNKAYNKLMTPTTTTTAKKTTTTATTPTTTTTQTTAATPATTETAGTTVVNSETPITNGVTQVSGLNDGYNTMWEQYQKLMNNGLNNANSYYQQAQTDAENAYNLAKETNANALNANYDKSAKDYYALYRQNQLALPEELAKLGITGGATETAQLGLLNNYAQNYAQNEADRNNALNSNDINYNNQIASLKQEYADKIASNSQSIASELANAYLTMAQNKYNEDLSNEEEKKAAKKKAEATDWNSKVQVKMNEQLAKGNTVYYWEDDDGKYHWSLDPTKAATSGYTYKTLKPKKSDGDGDGKSKDKINETTYNLIVNEIQDQFGNATTASAARNVVYKTIEAYADQLNDATADAIRKKFGV